MLVGVVLLVCAVAAVPQVGRVPDWEGRLTSAAALAYAVRDGQGLPGWDGGRIPYSWGGGHAASPGPSRGTCLGYSGSIRPCPAARTVGLDCSGLVRWIYDLAFGQDVLGMGTTDDHLLRLRQVASPDVLPGDLVYYGKPTGDGLRTHHVGIYVGDGKMINALRTGTRVRLDDVTVLRDLIGYYRLKTAW
ncbi:hypothetical protein Misp01_47190 [Microtetraspora sp. NBRC 13810]|nr:hypothetical protein Misp01_47190 [Microtetraspora sp. NBRC 13810]